ncbi:MAG: GGDEF domain-containing protein [Pseudomonadota bacterium]
MIDKDLEISKEPLWAIPVPIQERLQASLKDREHTHFLLCGLYSAVAIIFLMLFGMAALYRGDVGFGLIIFAFALTTFAVYTIAWYTHRYSFTKHFLTLLMGTLCLYLFYTGGTANTGPLYYFVFPLVAMFLQGSTAGVFSVVTLMVLTWVLEAGTFGFDTDRYTTTFVVRITAIYTMMCMLAYFFEYFRVKAERELMVSIDDLNQLTFGDLSTSLANRRLMEKLLVAELGRAQRYPTDCCLMFIEADYLKVQTARYGSRFSLATREILAQLLRKHLRSQDIPGCWDEARFLVLLPETALEGAEVLANRLLTECAQQSFVLQGVPLKFTISVGVAKLAGQTPDQLVADAAKNLTLARKDGGNRVVMA